MSDAELVESVVQRIDALHLALCDRADADEATPRDQNELRRTRHEVDKRRKELLNCINHRLEMLAVEHLHTAPGEWGARFTDELLKSSFQYGAEFRGTVQARYHALLPLAKFLRAGETPPAKDDYAKLRKFAGDNLRGLGRAVIEALCNAGGELPLADIKALCKWPGSIDDSWNSLRKRLNKKITSLGYELTTHDRKARLGQTLPSSTESSKRRKNVGKTTVKLR